MLAGFSGHLISEQYLEQRLDSVAPGAGVPAGARTSLRRWRERQRHLGPASSLRTLFQASAEPFVRALGFDVVDDVRIEEGVTTATLRTESATVALSVTSWGEQLDRLWRPAVIAAAERGASWCLLFNGTHARLLHAGRLFSRRYAEFDLDFAIDDDRAGLGLWMLFNAESFRAPASAHVSDIQQLVEHSDRHASHVCRSLRDGVLEASTHVLRALLTRPRDQRIEDVFEQSLTVVYRILFLLFAEARSLVPLWHPVYRASYSLESLRDHAVRRSSAGLWDALRAVTRLAHAGCRAGDLNVTPFNGRLFAPSRTPLADRHDLDDEAARHSLIALSTRPAPDREGRERIAYRDVGVEQLGAVYETLLDYRPHVERQPDRTPGRSTAVQVSLNRGSGVRKATGTFYTPQAIAGYVIRQALAPLVRDRTPERILDLRVLDPSMGSGAFLVGACTFLAEAYEMALIEGGGCHASDLGPQERASIRRVVAERCLFGVDLNPMAVQLARLSLWLATLAADRPLSFLDHHLLAGDSVLGTWVSSLRHAPQKRRAKVVTLPLFDDLPAADALREALPTRFRLALEPNDTPDQVRAKERALASLARRDASLSRWKRVADLWCARWFTNQLAVPAGTFSALADTILTGQSALPASTSEALLALSETIASSRRFFHWELEFPEVFFHENGERRPDGGFDAVIGNPPWDMVRADGHVNDRVDANADAAAVVRFTRDAGVYSAQSDGHANRYQLFLERAIRLTRPGGRVGLVLPGGLACDHGSAPLRRLLFSRCAVDGLVAFDNRRAIFPIHRSVRFLLLSATTGSSTDYVRCRFGEVDPAILERDDHEGNGEHRFPVQLSTALLQKLSGDDLTIPDLRSPMDVAIVERAAMLFPALGSSSGWGIRFGRELNATEDRRYFATSGRGVPVVEGKQIEPFRVRVADSRFVISSRDALRLVGERYQRPRLAYRDVASATNRVTLIAAVMPARSVSTHTVFCLKTPISSLAQHFLAGLFNSFVVNYLARLRVTTHVTSGIVEGLPVPVREQAGASFGEIAGAARRLARHQDAAVAALLNARVARLYRLSFNELAHVLATFPLVPRSERDDVIEAFRRLPV